MLTNPPICWGRMLNLLRHQMLYHLYVFHVALHLKDYWLVSRQAYTGLWWYEPKSTEEENIRMRNLLCSAFHPPGQGHGSRRSKDNSPLVSSEQMGPKVKSYLLIEWMLEIYNAYFRFLCYMWRITYIYLSYGGWVFCYR
jgi:hypothetical protein